jgi:thiosulfate/3-mercaptopyruvate sulfurtransferase
MFITTEELQKIKDDTNLLLIDTRSFKEYSEGHIPGSVNLDLFSFHWIDTTKQGMESFKNQFQRIFSFAGISNQKKVVFYDDISGMLAARGVWLLMCFSHPQVFMLDGGLQKWKNENLPVETKPNPSKPEKFVGEVNPNFITGFEFIRNNLDSLKIIDSRSPEEFSGTLIRAAQSGHIPNATNIDWQQNLENDGTMKNDAKLSELYQIPKDTEIVTYCQGAYRAAHTFLALKKIGFKHVRVYLGSWGEWGNRLELPVGH